MEEGRCYGGFQKIVDLIFPSVSIWVHGREDDLGMCSIIKIVEYHFTLHHTISEGVIL